MVLLAPAPTSTIEQHELDLLIREARRRQRRRRLAILLLSVATAVGGYLVILAARSSHRSEPPLARRLHFPSLKPGQRCPVSPGYTVNNPYFVGDALGNGPVRVLLADRGDILHGRVDLGGATMGSLHGLQTLWFAMPGYDGPFVIRAARLGRPGLIEDWPSDNGRGSGPLTVSAGPTANSYPPGYRTVPGSTWIRSPGCYAWQIDARTFSEVIVVSVVATGS
jgi:hypothetical protein